MKSTNTEIYNAIDGSVWFEESDIEQLATAVESNDLTEVGRLYVAMLNKSILAERERSKQRSKAYGNLFRDALRPMYELTQKGREVLPESKL